MVLMGEVNFWEEERITTFYFIVTAQEFARVIWVVITFAVVNCHVDLVKSTGVFDVTGVETGKKDN